MATGFKGQIENRNFLSSIGFRFTLNRAPKVAFFSNTANIPSMTLGITQQPNYLTTIPVPGDKIEFGDFNLRFLVDENLENYMEIQNWMRGLGFPESLSEIYHWQNNNEAFEQPEKSDMNLYSDGTLLVLNSNQNFNFNVVFRSMFPYELGELKFDATDPDNSYFTADVKFKYMIYNLTNRKGEPLH